MIRIKLPDADAQALESAFRLADDRKYRDRLQVVRLSHRDGTGMVLISAFVRREGDWVYVFTRNHGFLAYPADELTECKEYEPPLPGPPGALADDYAGLAASADSGDEGGSVGFGDMPIHTAGLVADG